MLIYFDGHCNLCNGFVDFLIRRDARNSMQFASLQGETAARKLPPQWRMQPPPSLVVQVNDVLWFESQGAIAAISGLGGAWSLVKLAQIVPRSIRDWIYRAIARHRYAWFGRRETCRVPSAEERSRFLP